MQCGKHNVKQEESVVCISEFFVNKAVAVSR